MFERLRGLQRQAEPKFKPADVVVNATRLMNSAEAEFVGDNGQRQALIDGHALRGTQFAFAWKRDEVEIQFFTHIKRRLFSTNRKVSVFVRYPDNQDSTVIHREGLKLSSRKSKQNPNHTTAVIKTNLDGVRNKNDDAAVQNAQRLIALLS